MPDIISSNRPFAAEQQALLTALLDTLVPASDDGEMPSAADIDFVQHLQTRADAFIPELETMLQDLRARDALFAELTLAERCESVAAFSEAHPHRFSQLLACVYDCYYQDDRVRAKIGVNQGAPFPQGNPLTQGDLSLLDPVIENNTGRRYRR